MINHDDLPFTQLHELYPETYRKIVYKALLATFVKSIRDHYDVSGVAEMPDGKMVIRLAKRIGLGDGE